MVVQEGLLAGGVREGMAGPAVGRAAGPTAAEAGAGGGPTADRHRTPARPVEVGEQAEAEAGAREEGGRGTLATAPSMGQL